MITVRDGQGHERLRRPDGLPARELQLRVLRRGQGARTRSPGQDIGLEGLFYPTYALVNGDPVNVIGDDRNPTLSMLAYVGDLGLDNGVPQSVYALDKARMTQLKKPDGKMFRVDLQPGPDRSSCPTALGIVTFDGVERWTRLQISHTPDVWLTLLGVILALVGLLGSLFIRPRRVWVRARRAGRDARWSRWPHWTGRGAVTSTVVLSSVVDALAAARSPTGVRTEETPHERRRSGRR